MTYISEQFVVIQPIFNELHDMLMEDLIWSLYALKTVLILGINLYIEILENSHCTMLIPRQLNIFSKTEWLITSKTLLSEIKIHDTLCSTESEVAVVVLIPHLSHTDS